MKIAMLKLHIFCKMNFDLRGFTNIYNAELGVKWVLICFKLYREFLTIFWGGVGEF